jgi:hypothetical protein
MAVPCAVSGIVHGLSTQLPIYDRADGIRHGGFLKLDIYLSTLDGVPFLGLWMIILTHLRPL